MNAHQRIVTESELEKALDFLRDSAAALGEAKANSVRAGHYLKHIEALQFVRSNASSVEKKRADARTSDEFVNAIEDEALAAGEYEKLRALREAAALKVQAWQSESANYRAMKV